MLKTTKHRSLNLDVVTFTFLVLLNKWKQLVTQEVIQSTKITSIKTIETNHRNKSTGSY